MKISYDFLTAFHPDETFSLSIPQVDANRYSDFQFTVRAQDGENPGIVKIVFKNKRNEVSSFYVQGVNDRWKRVKIPLSSFDRITDWSSLSDISFVIESWNVREKQGSILLDEISFSKVNTKSKINQ